MSTASFDPEILQDFLTESGELLDQLEGDLVELESRPADADLINQIFRALHTIKGSASFLALTNLVEIAHAAESALNSARSGTIAVDETMMNLLLQAVDTIKLQMQQLAGGEDLAAADPTVVARLVDLGEGRQPAADDTPAPAAAEAASLQADDGRSRPLQLDPGKSALIEHFVDDLDAQLDRLTDALAMLTAATTREAAAETVEAVCGELRTTIGFFDFHEMLDLVRCVEAAANAGESLDAASWTQLGPRLAGVLLLLREQAAGLAAGRLVTPDADLLRDRIDRLVAGERLDDGELPADATAAEALDADGVTPPGAVPENIVASAAAGVASAEAAVAAVSQEADAADRSRLANAEAAVAAAQQPPADQPAAKARGGVEQTLRVEVGRLESLMNLAGELVLQKNRIGELTRRLTRESGVDHDLGELFELASASLDRVTGEIQMAVMRTRMQPLDKLFGKYPRLIRDLAQKTGKKIQLVVVGGDTEVDKSVIEKLGDPLVHIMRNSADHGLEPPEERLAAGKPDVGTISLTARHEGSNVRIIIADDGRGLPREKIARKAVERGLASEAEIASMSDEAVYRFIFDAGFSTAEQVSDLSGRGVGMDVVRTKIEKLSGTVDVVSTPGRGTQMHVTIPLTVAIMPAMMVEVHGEKYAIPLDNILEIVRPTESQLSTIIEERVIRLRDSVLPLVRGADVLACPPSDEPGDQIAVVLTAAEKRMALLVGRVIGQQEIVIKPLDDIEQHGPISGATVRSDGGVSLIVDVAEVIRRAG